MEEKLPPERNLISLIYQAIVIGNVAGGCTIVNIHLGERLARLAWLSMSAEITSRFVLWLIGLNILRENGVFNALL